MKSDFDLTKVVGKIAMQAKENQEEFIFETIRPYCENILQIKINKEELKQILLNGVQKTSWIPTSEPPKETGEYLVTIRWRNHYGDDYKYSVVKRKYYADVKTWDDSLVIAYIPQPLPEPFREEDKE